MSFFTHPQKIALIGYGKQGRLHLQSLQPYLANRQLVLCGVCDVVRADDLPNTPFFETAQELIVQLQPDVVLITVPNAFHYSIAKFALEHGCDVIKEKPLAITLEEGKKLCSLARHHRRMLITLQQRYFSPLFQTLHRLLPEVGPVTQISSAFTINDQQKSWYWERELAGGGSWLNMGWHSMCVLEWYFGSPQSIHVGWNVGGRRDWHYDTDHSALAKVVYPSGAMATVFVSCVYPKSEVLRIEGRDGCATLKRDLLMVTSRCGSVICSSPTSDMEIYVAQFDAVLRLLLARQSTLDRDLAVLEAVSAGSTSAKEVQLSHDFSEKYYESTQITE